MSAYPYETHLLLRLLLAVPCEGDVHKIIRFPVLVP
jgi:hypothetical protein